MALRMEVAVRGRVVAIALFGDFDGHEAARVGEVIARWYARGAATVVLDLSATRFLGEYGQMVILNAYHLADTCRRIFALVNPSEQAENALSRMYFDRFILVLNESEELPEYALAA